MSANVVRHREPVLAARFRKRGAYLPFDAALRAMSFLVLVAVTLLAVRIRWKTSFSPARSTSFVFQPAAFQASAWLWPPLRVWFAHQGRCRRADAGSANPRIVSISAKETSQSGRARAARWR